MADEGSVRPARRSQRSGILKMVGLILILAVIVVAWLAFKAPRGMALLDTFPQFLQSIAGEQDQERIGQVIFKNFKEYRADARNWSFVHFGSLFLSAAFAAIAGVILKLEFLLINEPLKKDIAALLAMTSALLITLSTVGGFQQRWTSNRLAAAKMEKLAYEFMMTGGRADLNSISGQIQDISYERNAEIISIKRDSKNGSISGGK